ncbi:hypothetical protein E3U44_05200 [Nitrosococcus wardiae]|uniref:Uncharacterized protein n=1 Tax=Nitrosococcus wardiae TaxID=1814290 RepID=A0A4P7BXE3_9GAMM|nr:hypothetical protein [Nitrosococcus wardiae]QBQ53977.1 hypothetical protein E3U44_05200 [Nitrosococcus wardiae]
MMTIIIAFYSSHYRMFKHDYTDYVVKDLQGAFLTRVSNIRFVELMGSALIPLYSDLVGTRRN